MFEKTLDTHFASVLDLRSTKFEQLSNDSRDITSRSNKQHICKIVTLKLKLGQSFFSIVYRCRELRKTMTLAVIIFWTVWIETKRTKESSVSSWMLYFYTYSCSSCATPIALAGHCLGPWAAYASRWWIASESTTDLKAEPRQSRHYWVYWLYSSPISIEYLNMTLRRINC